MPEFDASRDCALALDAADPLRGYRDQFNFPDDRDGRRNIYVCGNSLGLQPKLAVDYVVAALSDWARLGVDGHFEGNRPWVGYHRLAASGFAALTGALEHEVVAMNTLTVNLHVLMAGFYRPAGRRNKIVIESTAFPSDYFAVSSQLRMHGLDPAESLLEWTTRDDDLLHIADLAAILDEHGDDIALLLLPGVQYLTGQVLDMAAVCSLARKAGCRIGLDLAHAIGNVPLQLHEWAPDFAAWCTYKYLNGGPGAIGGVFVHERHLHGSGDDHLTGWWGHDEATRFRMQHRFAPAVGAERWQLSNPPILSLAPVVASLELFQAAGMDALREKSRRQTAYLEFLLAGGFAAHIRSLTPPNARGCQLSLVVCGGGPDAREVFRHLKALHVTCDWREPNVIRLAPVPLYNSYEDIYELCERLGEAIKSP